MTEKSEMPLRYSSLTPEKNRKKKLRSDNTQSEKNFPALHESRVRLGRGRSSGHGKTCGRGQKGQKSRAGSSRRAGFEGGQMPLHRRIPKRGFTNIHKKRFQIVNFNILTGAGLTAAVDPQLLEEKGLIKHAYLPVKILGTGEALKTLIIEADAFSGAAKKKLEDAGGTCKVRLPVARKKVRERKEAKK